MSQVHYTAAIKITKTETHSPPPASFNTRNDPPKSEGTREVQEVTSLVIRADSIEALITKATAHLQLLED